MSAASSTITTKPIRLRRAKPSFLGLVRGEFFKIRRQWSTWIMLILMIVAIIVPYLIVLTISGLPDQIKNDPSNFFYMAMEIGLTITRVFAGFFLLIVTARMIGLEYRLGTIRLLLARGTGRVQLLCAKLFTMVLMALVLLILGLLFSALMTVILVGARSGNLNAFNALSSQLWSDAWTFVLTVLVSMGVTILLATAAAEIGRASAFGLSVALAFFALDNIGTLIMQVAFFLTRNDFWLNVTAYFLGPNLNFMPHALVNKFSSIGATPLYLTIFSAPPASPNSLPALETHGILVDGTHTLVVAGIYAAIFLAAALWLTWKRDVHE